MDFAYIMLAEYLICIGFNIQQLHQDCQDLDSKIDWKTFINCLNVEILMRIVSDKKTISHMEPEHSYRRKHEMGKKLLIKILRKDFRPAIWQKIVEEKICFRGTSFEEFEVEILTEVLECK